MGKPKELPLRIKAKAGSKATCMEEMTAFFTCLNVSICNFHDLSLFQFADARLSVALQDCKRPWQGSEAFLGGLQEHDYDESKCVKQRKAMSDCAEAAASFFPAAHLAKVLICWCAHQFNAFDALKMAKVWDVRLNSDLRQAAMKKQRSTINYHLQRLAKNMKKR